MIDDEINKAKKFTKIQVNDVEKYINISDFTIKNGYLDLADSGDEDLKEDISRKIKVNISQPILTVSHK